MTKELTPTQNAISGSIAGVISRFTISPFDVIKIRLQLQSAPTSVSSILTGNQQLKYQSILQSAKLIVQEEGIFALWRGNLPATYLYLSYGGIQFWSFYKFKEIFKDRGGSTFLAGGLAGVIATTATYPFDLLRTRFAAQGTSSSLFRAIKDIYIQENIRGFYRGYTPTVISIIPAMGLVFEAHQFFQKAFYKYGLEFPGKELFCGGLAGIVSKTVVMPLDVIRLLQLTRKRLQVQGPTRAEIILNVPRYSGFISAGSQIIRHEGFFALYKGLMPALLKAGPSAAVTFLVVGQCQQLFRKYDSN